MQKTEHYKSGRLQTSLFGYTILKGFKGFLFEGGLMNRILIEENEIKPNRYVLRTLFFIMIIMLICEMLNEVGIFLVTAARMRTVFVLVIICTMIPLLLCRRPARIESPTTKYLVMSFAMLEILLAMTILGQWADLCLLMPLLLAAQYHNRLMNRFVLLGTLVIVFLSTYLSVRLGLAQVNFYTYLVQSCGFDVTIEPAEAYDVSQWVLGSLLYIALPRGLIILSLGTIVFSIGDSGTNNLENRIQATYLSKMDVLTGLYNRFSFTEKTEAYEKNRPDHLICVYSDADGLHALNDEKGHSAGDAFLQLCGKVLKDGFGEDCYRIGGDEFVVFTESMDEAGARAALDEIARQLDAEHYHMSSGICSLQDGMGISDMIRNAEQEMYRNKNDYYLSTNRDRRRH